MNTIFSVEIFSAHDLKQETINFFTAERWTAETETILMQHLHSLFSIINPLGKTLHIHFNAEVTDAIVAASMVNKEKNRFKVNNAKLTSREIEVLDLMVKGLTNNEIAEKLFRSVETVRSHRKNILIKTGSKNTASLFNYYYQAPAENKISEHISNQ
jgi:DNA-binding NarL/FixJ family response regulator